MESEGNENSISGSGASTPSVLRADAKRSPSSRPNTPALHPADKRADPAPRHHLGPDTDTRPERGKRALQREDRRFAPSLVVFVRARADLVERHIQQGNAATFVTQNLVAPVKNCTHYGLGPVQILRRLRPPVSFARVGEGQLRCRSDRPCRR